LPAISDYTALLSDYYWYPGVPAQRAVILTYSFVTASAAGNSDPVSFPFSGAIEPARQDLIRQALDAWASISGIIFVETKVNEGDLNFGYYDLSSKKDVAGDAGYPISGAYIDSTGLAKVYGGDGEGNGGVVRIDTDQASASNNNYLHVVLHEIGHALGLKHPFDGDLTLEPGLDNGTSTVMSYNDYFPYLGTMDVQAIQAIYGDNNNDARYPFEWSWNAATETLMQNGTAGSEYIKGSRANDIIYSSGGSDAIYTYAGNDIVYSDLSSSEINFGPGVDRVIYRQVSTEYEIRPGGTNGYVYIYRKGDYSNYEGLFNIEIVQFSDKEFYFNGYTPPLSGIPGLFAANPDTAKGIASAYEVLQAGVPNEAGFTFLVNSAVSTNFGAGAGVVFNQENIFINLVNNLVQGNADAKARFDAIAIGATLQEKVTSLYNGLIPASKYSADGLAFIVRPEGLQFYRDVASERGIAGTDGAAIVSLASLLKIVVAGDYGIGNAVNDLIKAVAAGNAAIPATGTTLTPLETADGTAFDGDDAAALARIVAPPETTDVYLRSSEVNGFAYVPSVSMVGLANAHDLGLE
jgi:hypothetical protein